MEAKATTKFVRTTPRKMRRVVDMIRGQHVVEHPASSDRMQDFRHCRLHARALTCGKDDDVNSRFGHSIECLAISTIE